MNVCFDIDGTITENQEFFRLLSTAVKDLDWYQRFIFQKIVYCKAKQVDVYFDDEEKVIKLFKRFLPEVQVFQVHRKGLV